MVNNIHFNIKKKLNIPLITAESLTLGILLAAVGGFLDAYTFIGRGGVFANAQTGNIIMVASSAISGNWRESLTHVFPILAFIVGVIVSETLREHPPLVLLRDLPCTTLIIEAVILFIIGFVPNTVPNDIVTISISFVASLQYCAFKKLINVPFATTFCTGNLRSASIAAYSAFTKKDREALIKSARYFTVIFFFFIGAIVGGILTLNVGAKSIWAAVIVLILSFILLNINETEIEEAMDDNSKAS